MEKSAMSDPKLIERLRKLGPYSSPTCCKEAADEIERLNRVIEVEALNWARQHDEIERLRAALAEIADGVWAKNGAKAAVKIARKALEGVRADEADVEGT
jgi:hypothetical protein